MTMQLGKIVNAKFEKNEVKETSVITEVTSDDSGDVLVVTSHNNNADCWILDSACSYHMSPNRDWFATYKKLENGSVLMGNNHACRIVGIGTVRIKMHDGVVRTLTDVRHIPELRKNLISLGCLDSVGYQITVKGGVLQVLHGALILIRGNKQDNLYFLDGSTLTRGAAVTQVANSESSITRLWHMRLGHMSEKGMNVLIKRGFLSGVKSVKLGFCEHCIFGNQHRVKYGSPVYNTKGQLDYVHTDVWGPSRFTSFGGSRYFVSFIDDYTRRVWVYTMASKDQVFGIFLKWKSVAENQSDRKLKCLRSNNGSEYISDPFMEYCQKEGITRYFTVKRATQQNEIAERMNCTLLETTRCMLSNARLGGEFWAEALNTACFLINRSPSGDLDYKIPYQLWSGKPIILHSLKIFGCIAYFHMQNNKLEPRAKKGIFLGYQRGVKGYRLWCPELGKFVVSRDVTFDESPVLSAGMIDSQVEPSRDGRSQVLELDTQNDSMGVTMQRNTFTYLAL